MQPRFEILPEKKLVGLQQKMSFAQNKTFELWHSFMPQRKEITHAVNSSLYSVEIYDKDFFKTFDPQRTFEKWAAVEVEDLTNIPEPMQPLVIPSGLYAVFIHKGPASEGPKTYNYIFLQWLPHSDYTLDDRPHFALMGEKYQQHDPSSEEEIWIPVQPK